MEDKMEKFSQEEKEVIFESMLETWSNIEPEIKVMGYPKNSTGDIIDSIFDASYIVTFSSYESMNEDLYEKIIENYRNGFRNWAIRSWKRGAVA